MERIVVVGASLAGVHAAQAISRLGFDGDLVVVGAEPHRPYDRPPLSKEYLAGSAADDRIVLRPAAEPAALGATWLLGRRATSLALDRDGGGTVAVDDGSEIPADGIVIATGAVARPLPGQPELDGLTTLRTLDDARRLRHRLASSGPGGGTPSGLLGRLVVVGLGFIGAEVAATARSLGWDVTVIELAESPLSRVLDPEAGASVATLHHDNGVDIRLGTSVAEVEGAEGAVIGVRTDSGEHISCETVLVGIGVLPDTDWLSGSGLAVDDGVLADSTMLAAPGVVVAGDVARWPNLRFGEEPRRVEQWDNAVEMGAYAGRRLLAWAEGQEVEPFAPVPWFWSDQYDRKFQLAGWPDGEPVMAQGDLSDERFVRLYLRDGQLRGAFCSNRPRQAVIARQLVADGASRDEALERLG